MPSISTTAVSAIAFIAMVQYCPAPFLAAIPAAIGASLGGIGEAVGVAAGVAGAVEGGISAANGKRDTLVSSGMYHSRIKRQDYGTGTAWQDCHDQLAGATVTFSAPSVGNVLVAGIPSACMTLSTIITGQFDEGNPVPEGTDSILFSNLSNESIQQIQDALNARAV